MKKLFLASLVLLFFEGITQSVVPRMTSGNNTAEDRRVIVRDNFIIPRYMDTVAANLNKGIDSCGAKIYTYIDNKEWIRKCLVTGKTWVASGGEVNFDTLQYYVKISSQNPTATLTGNTNLELMSAGDDLPYNLMWTAGRLAGGINLLPTANITSIVVGGVSKSFTNPSIGNSVSGIHSVNVPRNINTTYFNVVTTEDNKTATASSTFTFSPRRYFGWVTDVTNIGTTDYDDNIIRNLSSELTASKSKTWNTDMPIGVQFYVFAYWSGSGLLSQFDFNGFPSIEAMNVVTRTFTNSLGYTGTWTIYWNKNGQTTNSSLITN